MKLMLATMAFIAPASMVAQEAPAPAYQPGTYTYRTTSNLSIEGIPEESTITDLRVTIEADQARRLKVTYTIIKSEDFEAGKKKNMGGVKPAKGNAVALITPDGRRVYSFTTYPETEMAQMYLPEYRFFLPPVPPSNTIGTKCVF